VYERGGGDVPVRGKVSGGKAFMEDVNNQGDDTAGLGALGSSGGFVIISINCGWRLEDKEFKELGGETIRARDSPEGKA